MRAFLRERWILGESGHQEFAGVRVEQGVIDRRAAKVDARDDALHDGMLSQEALRRLRNGNQLRRAVHAAAISTREFATTTGHAVMAPPYTTHKEAPTICTRRMVTARAQKYDDTKTAVAIHPR